MAADSLRFSILLPTHSSPDTLGAAIGSVLDQSVPDFELLLVLDGADEATRAIANAVSDPRLRVFDLPKAPGFGYANRNVALQAARGDLIAFMSDDDIYAPDHLAHMSAAFTDDETEIAFSAPVWVAPTGEVLPEPADLGDPEHFNAFFTYKNFFPAACIVHKREVMARDGMWPEDGETAGDWDLWLRILEGGDCKRFAFVDALTALHFKAARKTGATWGPPSIMGLERLAQTAAWWPERLKPVLAPRPSCLQEQYLALIRDDPGFLESLRRGREELYARLASRSFGGHFLGDARDNGDDMLWRPGSASTQKLATSAAEDQDLLQRMKTALGAFANDIDLTPQVANPLYNALVAGGATEAADALARAAAKAEGDKPWAILLSARAEAARGELNQAIETINGLYALHPQSWGVRRLRVQLLLKGGQAALALADIRALAAQFPHDPGIAVEEFEAHEALGDPSAALSAIKRALALAPNNRKYAATVRALEAQLHEG